MELCIFESTQNRLGASPIFLHTVVHPKTFGSPFTPQGAAGVSVAQPLHPRCIVYQVRQAVWGVSASETCGVASYWRSFQTVGHVN